MTTLLRAHMCILVLPFANIIISITGHKNLLLDIKHGMSLIPRWFCVDAPGNGKGTAGAVALVEALKIQNPKELSLRSKFCFSGTVQPLYVMRLSGGNVYFVRDIGVDVCNSTFSVVNKYGDN